MPNLPGRLSSIAVIACLLTGCQPPAPVPSPVPTYRCTPEAGGAEFDCSQKQYDDMVAKDKLYAEAEAVYRKFLAEEVRILRLGGMEEPTPVISETASGEFLSGVMADLRNAKAKGITVDQGSREIDRVERLVGVSKEGSDVAVSFCVDSRGVHFLRGGSDAGFGSVTSDEVYFARIEGQLKAIGADGQEVSSC